MIARRAAWLLMALGLAGCASPYRSDRGALAGGLAGAGVGALIGNAVGDTGAGAAIGAGVGALSGAAVGDALDEVEARNRAEIEARLGHPVAAGAATIDDVISMTRAGVTEEVMTNHVRIHGMAMPLQANDLILLQQNGVPSRVVQQMQQPPQPPPVAHMGSPPPVIVEEHHYGPPWWGPPYPYRCQRHGGFGWGVAIGN